MQARVQLITLGVPDLEAAHAFYVDGLGWPVSFHVPGEITFIQVGPGLLLGLFSRDALAADISAADVYPSGPVAFTLAQVVATEAEVVAALEAAETAGATILKPGQYAAFGGFHGYFEDPSGFRWEVATNPGFAISPDGKVTIGPIES
jgi:uncharacterized protein